MAGPRDWLGPAERAMLIKDARQAVGDKRILVPMLVVPALLVVLVPVLMFVGLHLGSEQMQHSASGLLKKIAELHPGFGRSQVVVEMVVNYLYPAQFLLVPVMAASVMAASSFVGEKEHKTFESLLYTPMTVGQLYRAKVLGTFVVAYAIALVSFVVFGVVIDLGSYLEFGTLIFPNPRWLLLIFWVTPAITVLCIALMVWVSARAQSFQEAQQWSLFLVLPIVLSMIAQTSGAVMLNEWLLLAFGAALYVVDFLVLGRVLRRVQPEKLL
ncbi:MAG: ABC transporter permease subunit [Deltaproteobacteria bacterium]|nr:ABC transporter permease subunit [Deltaproteobacteria bacterium]